MDAKPKEKAHVPKVRGFRKLWGVEKLPKVAVAYFGGLFAKQTGGNVDPIDI